MDETTFKLLDTPVKIAAFRTALMEQGNQALRFLPANAAVEQLKKQTICTGEQPDEREQELEKGLSKAKIAVKGQMWALLNPAAKLVLFEFSPSRATINAVLLLKDYQGLLMADAYSGYIRLAKLMGINITLLSCWAHARRYFLESQNPEHPDPVVREIIHRIDGLYHIEKQVKGRAPRKKKRARKRSSAILRALKIYLDEKIQLYAPKEAVAVAIQHCLNHWEALTTYTQYGSAPIDNNQTERAIRPITINRKNVLFLGSVEHAAGAALMYSLMECCRMHQVDPFTWLLDILKRIEYHPKEQLVDLLPHNWKKLNQCGKSPPGNT
jgi:transposase